MWRSTVGCIVALTLSIFTIPLTADGQTPVKVHRIGFLNPRPAPVAFSPMSGLEGLRQGLRELAYVESQNLVIEYRWGAGREDRLPDLAADLVRLKVDVIFAVSSAGVRAARKETQTIPIVAVDLETDPVASGLASSLARPAGNITGLFLDLPALSGKLLELLKEAVPDVTRVAILWDAATDPVPLRAMEVAAQSLGVPLHILEVRSPEEFESAFATASRGGARALIVLQSATLDFHQTRLADLAATSRLPAIAMFRGFAAAGGLLAYGPDLFDTFRRAVPYVDKILKGAQPADLPIERPMRFKLVINLKTAKALGITIPPHLLVLADEVLQ